MKDDKTSGYDLTGVYATPEEIKLIKSELQKPVMMIGGVLPEPEKLMHSIALSHGLPEIHGWYGCDLRDGEFLYLPEATQQPPDHWPPKETP